MGTTIEFYSAYPKEFIALFSSQDEDMFFETLKTYPVADFSFHLFLPDDMDRFCQALIQHNHLIPPTFRNLFVEQIWYDGLSESLTVISDTFAIVFAGLSDIEIEHVARESSKPFHYQEPLHETPTYQALLQLRSVIQDVTTNQGRSLILHLVG